MPRDSRETAMLFNEIRGSLSARYGELIGTGDLWHVLGYPSRVALQRAYSRGTVGLTLFEIENRRGRFALTTDVSNWLANQRQNAVKGEEAE